MFLLVTFTLDPPGIPQKHPLEQTHLNLQVPPAVFDLQASASDIQQWLEKLNPTDSNYQPLLLGLLSHQGLKSHIQGLQGSDLGRFVELLDNVSEIDSSIH